MRNPGTDFHRRAADDEQSAAISRRNRQRRLNAAEWLIRGSSYSIFDPRDFACGLQSELEDPRTTFKRAAAIRGFLASQLLAKVLAPSRAPWSRDGVR